MAEKHTCLLTFEFGKAMCLFQMVEIKKRRVQVVDRKTDVSWETPVHLCV